MIRTAHAHLPVYAVTHPGMSGKDNEDRYAVSAFQLSEQDSTPAVLAVLADGIGGHRAGEVAAEIAVEAISQHVAQSSAERPLEALNEALQLASQKIYAAAQADASRAGMGSTCCCAWIIRDRLYTATVGDSRLYLVREGAIVQVSTDHTWIQEALERGIITPEQVQGHPNQHVIRRYLGSPTPVAVDFRLRTSPGAETSEANQGLTLQPGDLLLLCSDGLSDLVNEAEIFSMLQMHAPDAALHTLLNLANKRGGHDNITMVLLAVPKEGLTAPIRRSRGLTLKRALLAALLLGLLAGAVWGILSLVNAVTTPQPTRTPTSPPSPLSITLTAPPGGASATPQPSPMVMPSATPAQPAAPSATPQPIVTRPGATITAWPTNTLKP